MTRPEPELDRLHSLRDDHIDQCRSAASRLGGNRLRALRYVTEAETALGIRRSAGVIGFPRPAIEPSATDIAPAIGWPLSSKTRPDERDAFIQDVSALLALRSKALGSCTFALHERRDIVGMCDT